MPRTRSDPLQRLRAICLSFPEVTERPSHGSPACYVRDKTTLVHAWVDGDHDHTFPPDVWSRSLLGGIPASRPFAAPGSSSASGLVAAARQATPAFFEDRAEVVPALLVRALDAESP